MSFISVTRLIAIVPLTLVLLSAQTPRVDDIFEVTHSFRKFDSPPVSVLTGSPLGPKKRAKHIELRLVSRRPLRPSRIQPMRSRRWANVITRCIAMTRL